MTKNFEVQKTTFDAAQFQKIGQFIWRVVYQNGSERRFYGEFASREDAIKWAKANGY